MTNQIEKSSEKIKELELSTIKTNPDNPRIINKKSQKYQDLLDSITASGVLIPVHVRPTKENEYILLSGERRIAAALDAKLEKVKAVVHFGLTDEEAFEITFAENFAREDLSPLEEGKATVTLLGKYNNDAKAVASKMGKSETWVRSRSLIATNLSDTWRNNMLSNGPLSYFTAAHLALIVRFPQSTQDIIFKDISSDGTALILHLSVKELDESIAKQMMLLQKAPFDTAKCKDCQKRSSCQPILWSEKAEDSIDKNDKCLDLKCWDGKEIARKKQYFVELQKEYPNLVCISKKSRYECDTDAKKFKKAYGQFFYPYEYNPAKESSRGAVPALVICGKGIDKIEYIKITKNENDRSSKPKPSKPKTLKELRAELEMQRWSQVEESFCEKLQKTKLEDIKHSDIFFVVGVLINIFGYQSDIPDLREIGKLITFYKKDPDKAKREILQTIYDGIYEDINYSFDTSGDEYSIRLVRLIASLIGIDIESIYKEIRRKDEFKKPTEWADLKADGTPKKESTPKETTEDKPKDKTSKKSEGKDVK